MLALNIKLDLHFVHEKIVNGELSVQYVSSHEQTDDILTKPLSSVQFHFLQRKLSVISLPLSLRRGAVEDISAPP